MLIASAALSDQELSLSLDQGLLIITTRDKSPSTLLSISIDHIVYVTSTVLVNEIVIIAYLIASNDLNKTPVTVEMFNFVCQPLFLSQFIQLEPTFAKLCRNIVQDQRIDIILNPSAGAPGQAETYVRDVIIPLFKLVGVRYHVTKTQSVGDGGKALRRLREQDPLEHGAQHQSAVLIVGGDGTTHELINDLLLKEDDLVENVDSTDLILLPFGTANALYYHLFPPESTSTPINQLLSPLYSLIPFLRGTEAVSSALPLNTALNTLHSFKNASSSTSSSTPTKVITSVVSSAALHASILHDAESLRASHPGVERFKVAAQQNSTTWYEGKLTLLPNQLGNGISKYDSKSKSLLEVIAEKERVLEGPFCYVVSSLISRFESNFVVAPLRSKTSKLAPSSPSIDLVLIRPLRDQKTSTLLSTDGQSEAAKNYVSTVWSALGGMYQGGSHIDVTYKDHPEIEIVEYFRCSGFIWEPIESDDKKSNLVCLDGALHDLGKGGRLKVEALGTDRSGLRVWA